MIKAVGTRVIITPDKAKETTESGIIVDIKELHAHLIKNKTKKVYLEELISSLDWNIVLPKN